MLTVHHLSTSQSDRIVWLCEELGIAYDLKRYERDPVTRLAPAEYQALHPIGTAPVITDGDLVLGESGAIVEYIIQRYGNGRLAVGPKDAGYPDYLFWFHFANGSFMPATMMGLFAGMVAASGPEATKAFNRRLDRGWDMIEARLGESAYLAGDEISAADIMTLFPLTTMRLFSPARYFGLSPYPAVSAKDRRTAGIPAGHGQGRPGLRRATDLKTRSIAEDKMMPKFDLLIRGGTIIDGLRSGRYVGDIGVRDGKIAAIGGGLEGSAERVLDASGLIVAPGFYRPPHPL